MAQRHLSSPARLIGAAALAVWLGGATAEAADEFVVVSAQGVALKPGQMVDAATPIKLAAGQRVTLIGSNGATIKLSGPYDGVPDPGGKRSTGVVSALVTLATVNPQDASMLGAVRAGGMVQPEPWLVDVSRTGDACIQESAPTVFWRPAASAEEVMELSPADHAWQAQAKWPAGLDRLALPPTFPAKDGQTYDVTVGGTTVSVTLHVIPGASANDAMRAAWMNEVGCGVQATLLARTLR